MKPSMVSALYCGLIPVFISIAAVARTQTLGRGEEPLLSSEWTLIESELSSPNFNSSVRVEQPFAIRYLNVV